MRPLRPLALVVVLHAAAVGAAPATQPAAAFPVGIYLDADLPGALPAIRRQGLDVVWLPPVEALWAAAEREGLRIVACLDGNRRAGGGYGPQLDQGRVLALVARHRTRRAVWAWDLADEPDVWRVPPARFRALADAVRRADPGRPLYTVVARPERYADYAGATDMLVADCYPVPDRPLDRVRECVARAVGAAGGRPVLAVIQAFKPAEAGRRAPTPVEVRAMTYLAVAAGARGVLFYTYGYGGVAGKRRGWAMPTESPALWTEVGRLAAELGRLGPALLAADAAGAPTVGPSTLRARARRHDGAWYVVVANPTPRRVTASVRLPHGAAVTAVTSVLEQRRVLFRRAEFDDAVPPYGVRVYRVVGR